MCRAWSLGNGLNLPVCGMWSLGNDLSLPACRQWSLGHSLSLSMCTTCLLDRQDRLSVSLKINQEGSVSSKVSIEYFSDFCVEGLGLLATQSNELDCTLEK